MHSKSFFAAAALAALATLSACQPEPETVKAGGEDPLAKDLAKAPPVQLPPAIKESKTYRCKDNSVVYVNFLTDGLTANVRDKQEEPPAVTLVAATPGGEFIGQGEAGKGFKLSGTGSNVTYTSPDSGTQSCKA